MGKEELQLSAVDMPFLASDMFTNDKLINLENYIGLPFYIYSFMFCINYFDIQNDRTPSWTRLSPFQSKLLEPQNPSAENEDKLAFTELSPAYRAKCPPPLCGLID